MTLSHDQRFAVSSHGYLKTPRYSRGDYPGYLIGRLYYVAFEGTTQRVDALVARAFLTTPPWEGCGILHRNGDVQDNRVANLAWAIETHHDAAITRRKKADPPLRIPRFEAGLHPLTTRCPNCGYPLAEEPAFLHCQGCGRYHRVLGGRLDLQHTYEAVIA